MTGSSLESKHNKVQITETFNSNNKKKNEIYWKKCIRPNNMKGVKNIKIFKIISIRTKYKFMQKLIHRTDNLINCQII